MKVFRPSWLDRASLQCGDAEARCVPSPGLASRIRRRFIDALPAPLAAPETPRLRRLRLSLLALFAAIAGMTAMFSDLARISVLAAVLVWQALALAALVIGIIWVRAKVRADDAWLYREEDE